MTPFARSGTGATSELVADLDLVSLRVVHKSEALEPRLHPCAPPNNSMQRTTLGAAADAKRSAASDEVNVNAAVELHDSQVVAVDLIAGVVTVRLRAYVQRSNGRPGFDPGSGWSQPVDLVFTVGVIEERPDELPFTLADGSVSGGTTLDGFIPLPTSIGLAVCFEARGTCGERLAVRGQGMVAVAAAEGVFVETFPGAKSAKPGEAAGGGGG